MTSKNNSGLRSRTKSECKERYSEILCAICQSERNPIYGKLNNCVHTFCIECIKEQSNHQTKCPLCKTL